MIALVDCNNFYASCERVFNPALINKPIVILSNNDGCIISRSAEAKALGIKMGIPLFEVRDLLKKHKVHVFSSNYALYADMSKRVMSLLKEFGQKQEIYSIDESFLDISNQTNLTQHGLNIKNSINQWLSLPVCVGIAHTKVLSKFANFLAKKYKGFNGVVNLRELGETRTDNAMQLIAVDEIWGIGRKIGAKLKSMGIKTVFDLKVANPKHLRSIFNINIEKIICELNGLPCIDFEELPKKNQQVVSSVSFAKGVTDFYALLSSLIHHVEKACKKIRKQNLYARQLTIFINTNRFKDTMYWYSKTIILPQALDSFRLMIEYLESALKEIYIPTAIYKKSGIILSDLITNEYEQQDLFDKINIKRDPIINTLEDIKRKYGKKAIVIAAKELNNNWAMKRDNLSNKFTTDIDELLIVGN